MSKTKTEQVEVKMAKREGRKVVPIEKNSEEYFRVLDILTNAMERGICELKLDFYESVEYTCEYMEWQLRCRPLVPMPAILLIGATEEEIERLFEDARCTLTDGRITYEIVIEGHES